MKRLLLTLAFTLAFTSPLAAFDLTATTTIKDANWPKVRDTLNAWRLTQFDPDGVTLKYSNLAALGESILRESMRRIVKIQCVTDPSTCPIPVKTGMADETAGATDVTTALDDIFAKP